MNRLEVDKEGAYLYFDVLIGTMIAIIGLSLIGVYMSHAFHFFNNSVMEERIMTKCIYYMEDAKACYHNDLPIREGHIHEEDVDYYMYKEQTELDGIPLVTYTVQGKGGYSEFAIRTIFYEGEEKK